MTTKELGIRSSKIKKPPINKSNNTIGSSNSSSNHTKSAILLMPSTNKI